MIRGMYAAASGMSVELARYQFHAHNLANVNTVGFRRTLATQRAFLQDLQAARGAEEWLRGGVTLARAHTDLLPGPRRETGNPLDLSLQGPGFFTVQTPAGLRYTRAGNFQLDPQGRLITASGHPVLGEAGELRLPPDAPLTVTPEGQLLAGDRPLGRLRLVELPPDAEATPEGESLLRLSAAVPAAATTVRQGTLEDANSRTVLELGAMLRGLRAYEAGAQALRLQDEALGELIRSSGPQ